ncbi:periplasmic nitrate reductase, NapE protein [Shewanella woodyi]|uniref:Periplasmic nitrate reductase NapE n=1 Tax=Shewanella woodyi (strain ATCC 51908 / MS32) TaxID=392500 RepID=B1KIA7_SHEWM|nr:periplasmic nitrate reductase, NapE protein [Shewanella woodyi]ACA86958.1 periplasmic nitrate reductase NapE [Shewanella woodyi ATCC 51908]
MSSTASEEKSVELKVFIFLTVFLAPLLSVILVSGLGFAIWFTQIIAGPPGAG